MDDLIKLVKTYRVTGRLAELQRVAADVFGIIEPDLRLFVLSSTNANAAPDVLQETLAAIAVSLKSFKGGSTSEFWGWCYRIARNKINDHFRKHASERSQPMPPDELWQVIDASVHDASLSAAERLDLEYAMNLLTQSKPECYHYLWSHFVFGFAYGEIAEQENLSYDAVRMKLGRCVDEVRALVRLHP